MLDYVITVLLALALWIFVRVFLQERPAERDRSHQGPREPPDQYLKLAAPSAYRACDSDTCVRCNRYSETRTNAKHVLEQSELNKIDRVLEALENKTAFEATSPQQPNVLLVPGLEAKPWWPTDLFSTSVSVLQESFDMIYQEYSELIKCISQGSTDSGWTENRSESGRWFTYYLYNQGQRVHANAARCPQTTQLVERSLSDCMLDCLFGNVFLSVMLPGTQIEPHYGPCNVRLRCHLGLHCPAGWQLTVGGVSDTWRRKHCLIFDDSFLHQVSHSDGYTAHRQAQLRDNGDTAHRQAQLRDNGDTAHRQAQLRDNAWEIPSKNAVTKQGERRSTDESMSSGDKLIDVQLCRAILILDFWHPGLSTAEKASLQLAFPSVA